MLFVCFVVDAAVVVAVDVAVDAVCLFVVAVFLFSFFCCCY